MRKHPSTIIISRLLTHDAFFFHRISVLSKVIIYTSRAVSHCYETAFEIWADFGQVGSTKNLCNYRGCLIIIWTMPILIFSLVQIIMRHPLCYLILRAVILYLHGLKKRKDRLSVHFSIHILKVA